MIRLVMALFALLLAVPVSAQSVADLPHTRAELILESRAPAPGKPFTALVLLTPKDGWHNYWSNPGDAGAPTRLAWTLAGNTPAPAEPRYPVPETLLVSGLMNHVYSHPNAMVVEITPPADLAPGTPYPVTVKADWLVCSDEQCVPEAATLSLTASIGAGTPDVATAAALASARAALPRPVDWNIRYALKDGRFILAVPFATPGEIKTAHFFPDADGVIDYAAPQSLTLAGDLLRIETKASGYPQLPADGTITGLIRIERTGDAEPLGFTFTARPGPVPAAGTPVAASTDTTNGATSLLPILALAVLGGLLLNVMPCVFPILSLKALSLAKGNVSPAKARSDALAYTAGTILVCAALGGLVLALRAAGSQVGWAFQLQDPLVIALLLLLVTAIALNLAGLFEISLGTGNLGQSMTARDDSLGSFATGALAAFIATPCTGPFMAGALGAALVLPPAAGLLVFAGLGFGLALPFLAIGFVPALRRRLPRPGAWMTRLRIVLSVPMFLTALALVWVLGRQSGVDGMAIGLAGALAIGLLLWWLGARQRQGQKSWLPAVTAVAVVLLAAVFIPTTGPAPASASAATLDAEPYTPARLADLRAKQQPVFLYMTADWCITCKVNEKGAMASPSVAKAFKDKGITVLQGDWTRGDPAISAWLAERGRAGIPVYVFFSADGREQELPQLLSVADLTSLAS
jgi:DsbC/DsbD-like thiol-disulfide interchange protein/cytochrome c biogenesis protein CcdA